MRQLDQRACNESEKDFLFRKETLKWAVEVVEEAVAARWVGAALVEEEAAEAEVVVEGRFLSHLWRIELM